MSSGKHWMCRARAGVTAFAVDRVGDVLYSDAGTLLTTVNEKMQGGAAMSRRINLTIGALATTIFSLSALSIAEAQAPKPSDFKISNIRQRQLSAPDYGNAGADLGGVSSTANKQWLMMEVTFQTEPDWADEITLKYYVLMGRGKDTQLFTGEATHLNVSRGNRHYSAMFVHPSTIDRFGSGKVEAVAVQMYYQGRLVDQASDPAARQRWWEQYQPKAGYLLKPSDSPWSVVAHKRYEAYKSTP